MLAALSATGARYRPGPSWPTMRRISSRPDSRSAWCSDSCRRETSSPSRCFVLLFSLRVNTGIGLLAAFAFSWVGPVLDPFADKLGAYVLTAGSMQATYASLFNLPLGPWFEFNNTVVVGSLVIGLWAMYPAYWLSLVAFRRIRSAPRRRRSLQSRSVSSVDPIRVDRRAA